jgi:hypothetical protein
MTTPTSFASSPGSQSFTRTGSLYTAEELAALHAHLSLQFRAMAAQHRPGCAFIAPYPTNNDLSPTEILVIPACADAAFFSVAFLQGDRTTMVVRIGEHGVWECSEDVCDCSEDDRPTRSLAATAELLFGIALNGHYREEIWTDSTTGRYEGGQSFFLDKAQGWQELGCRCEPRISSRLLRHKFSVLDRRYKPY